MYILNQSGTEIHNSEFFEKFCIAEKPDNTLIVASPGRDKQPNTLGRYKNIDEARGVIFELFSALKCGSDSFEMPLSEANSGERHVRDARQKRRGAS